MRPNRRVSALELSTTIALDTRAKELISAGRDVINMAVGEPDFPTPEVARGAARSMLEHGRVRYTPAAGTTGLRAAIAEHLGRTRGGSWSAAEVVVCHSAKHALSGALLSLIEPGDEVLLFRPAWVSYAEQIRFAGGTPVEVAPREDLGPDLEDLRRVLGPRARGMVLNSPCNPSGYVWSEGEVRTLVALAEERDLWILSDEIYRRLLYGGAREASPAALGGRARTVIVDGASKAYAMTGWRIGFAAAPRELADAIGRLQSQLTGCPNALSQAAYEAALRTDPPDVEAMRAEFESRRTGLVRGLRALGLSVPEPRGAFYVFPEVTPWLDARGSDGFCADLLEEQGLALVPGSAFGMDTHVRLSYAVGRPWIEQALERLRRFLAARPRVAGGAPSRG
jgi:aspartate aminotransferase